jgi:cephalosporin hydroxylase
MTDEKKYTRAEFENMRTDSADKMSKDHSLYKDALDVIVRADRYSWVHQTSWFGEPLLNLSQDMFAIQEIIFQTKPKYIIEIGVAWGGGLLFYSTLMEALGGQKVIGIDVYIPDDLKNRLFSHGKISDRLVLINQSSTDPQTIDQIKSIIGQSRDVLVILDSFHTHDHVLKELQIYSPLVGKGQYLICGDTIVEDIPTQTHRVRPWGPGNNPKTALRQFLKEHDRFEIDRSFDKKLLFSTNPEGYLKCCKD